jgi:hypothetical protein
VVEWDGAGASDNWVVCVVSPMPPMKRATNVTAEDDLHEERGESSPSPLQGGEKCLN